MRVQTTKVNEPYRKPTTELRDQGNMDFELVQPKLISVRCCPNDDKHPVFGEPFQLGGRVWYCAECGIEWRASLRTGYVRYYLIHEDGGTSELKKMKLEHFNEARYLEKKKNSETNDERTANLIKTESPVGKRKKKVVNDPKGPEQLEIINIF